MYIRLLYAYIRACRSYECIFICKYYIYSYTAKCIMVEVSLHLGEPAKLFIKTINQFALGWPLRKDNNVLGSDIKSMFSGDRGVTGVGTNSDPKNSQ